MKTLSRFITKFTGLIVAVLSCFDRVIFRILGLKPSSPRGTQTRCERPSQTRPGVGPRSSLRLKAVPTRTFRVRPCPR